MPAISRGQEARQLRPGLAALAGLEYRAYGEEHLQVFEKGTSEKAFEEELMLYGLAPTQEKPEGSPVEYDTSGEQYVARYDHITVAGAFAITEEAVEDNLYVEQSQRNVKALARAMHHTKQVYHANVLNNAASTSFLGGDGVAMCSTSHPAGGGTQSNTFSTLQQLNEGSVGERGHQHQPVPGLSRDHHPSKGTETRCTAESSVHRRAPDLYSAAPVHDEQRRKRDEGNGDYPEGLLPVRAYLTSTTAWFLITDVPTGLKSYERRALKRDNDQDFDTGNERFKMSERYSAGWTDWRGIYQGNT